jgi:hypothetical protein
MAIVVASGATPRSFAAGAFVLSTLQNGPTWTFVFTPSLVSTDAAYSGFKALLATNDNGGLWVVDRRIELYNGSGAGTLVGNSAVLTWSAGTAITVTINLAAGAGASSIVVSGALTGNGTTTFTSSGTYFTNTVLGVGQFTNSGTTSFFFTGTVGAVTDGGSITTSGTAACGGITSSGSVTVTTTTSGTAACGGITSTGIISAPNPSGVSACGGITSSGAMAVTVFASGTAACGGITSSGVMSGGSLWGTIGASGIGQRIDVTGPATGSFSTQFFARVPSSTVLINDRLVFNGRRWHVNSGGTLSAGAGPSGASGVQSDGTALVVPVAGGTELTMITQVTGSVILVWVMRENSASDTSPPTDNKGNTYVLQGARNVYAGFTSATSALYACFNAVGGANHVISATYPSKGGVGAEATLLAVEVPTGKLTSFIASRAFVETTTPGGGTINGPSVTTTGPAMIVVAHLGADNVLTPIGSSHPGTAGSPYLVCVSADGRVSIHVNGYVQGQLYYFYAPTAGTYFAVWATTAPAHLYAVAVQEAAWVSTSGTASCGGITSSGSMTVTASISGSASNGGISSSGSVLVTTSTSGTASIGAKTSAGTMAVTAFTSGAAACGGITSSGSVVATAGTVSGTAACGGITSTGVTTLATSGTAASGGMTSSGSVAVSSAVAGAAACGGMSSAGAMAVTVFASGTAACGEISSAGEVVSPGLVSGASVCGGITSTGAMAVTAFVSGVSACGRILSSGNVTGTGAGAPRPLPATIAISVVGAAPFRMVIG